MTARPGRGAPWLASIRPLLLLVDLDAACLGGFLVRDQVGTWAVFAAAVAMVLVCRGADLHRSRLGLSVLEEVPRLALATLIGTLVVVGVAPLAHPPYEPGTWALARFALVTFVACVLLRAAVYAVVHGLRRSGRAAHSLIIVGAGPVGTRLAEAFLQRPEYGLRPVGIIEDDPELSARDLPIPLLGGLDRLEQAMVDLGADEVLFAFPKPPDDQTVAVVRRCVRADRQVFVVPRFHEMMGMERHRRIEVIRDVAVLRLRRPVRGRVSVALKRAFDIVVSALAIIVLSPVMLACALAVRIDTGPRVIFKQTRVGQDGRNFTLLKFRSMRPATSAEGNTTWNIDQDGRLSPVGRFLRRTSLDELPQLFNVLRGDMSLVGPRPERPFFVREFGAVQERYHERHRVPTGLTGWAQVNDLRGDTSIDERVRFDNFYIDHWSLWSDIKIMLRTVRAVLKATPPAIKPIPMAPDVPTTVRVSTPTTAATTTRELIER